LNKPSDVEKTQWYFQRYTPHLPSAGEIVMFDRSWYNRAGVERVMGFCSQDEHEEFLRNVPEFERMLVNSGITLIKFYFSVSKEEQFRRFEKRTHDPLKQYKLSPVDMESQKLWDKYTEAKFDMLKNSHTGYAPWIVIRSDNKKKARINAIRHILRNITYPNKIDPVKLHVDDSILIHGSEEITIMMQEREIERMKKEKKKEKKNA
jgi:polyphosphate kinase 2